MMFKALEISTSGLVAQRHRINTIAGNIANINTTRNEQGEVSPFQRRLVTFMSDTSDRESDTEGVGVKFSVSTDTELPERMVYQPGHPDADANGVVHFPGINLTTEFVNAVEASRAYEANVAAIDISKSIMTETLKILA